MASGLSGTEQRFHLVDCLFDIAGSDTDLAHAEVEEETESINAPRLCTLWMASGFSGTEQVYCRGEIGKILGHPLTGGVKRENNYPPQLLWFYPTDYVIHIRRRGQVACRPK